MINDIQIKQSFETFENNLLKAVELQRKEFENANAKLTDMINNSKTSRVS